MRFDTSTAKAVSRVAGSSPLAGVLIVEIVGSDNSSATKGSSVTSVAGKNRFPARPCAKAASAAMTDASATVTMYSGKSRFAMISSPSLRGTRRDFLDRRCGAGLKKSMSVRGADSGSHFLNPDRYLDRAGILPLHRQTQ